MSKEKPDVALIYGRVVRVFVSSTFRDMQVEREELVKRIFPQLRRLCESRGVVWGEVDLRWGISDEQKAEGRVLPICLAEIQRCRPYFIGLLGERYGWVPDDIPRELIEQEPWLNEHKNHSVTELEILHGVLNNADMSDHAFFYFRDPDYVNRLAKGSDKKDFISEDEESKNKLSRLKERIRKSGLPVRENYPDPRTLGEMVLNDLKQVINQLFPEGSQPDALDREAAEHEIFAKSRARVYIGRKSYFETLDQYGRGSDLPVVVLGESGSGKSAFLANWGLTYIKEHPKDLVIMHFIGASASSADWQAMLRHIMAEFKRHLAISGDIPEKPDELRSAFANWLNMAAVKGRVILIIDALNQLEDRDGAPDLVWLPPVIPDNIRLILSTLPGRPLVELNKRNWPTLEIKSLEIEERKRLISEYLALYAKSISKERAEKIISSNQSANPLFLQALLEELRVFGVYEKLDERIGFYLQAGNIPKLYEKILSRYEEDYETERPRLVKDAMSLIWAARRGLSEAELLELLGQKGNPLPNAVWAPLYLAGESSLVNREGLLNFFHDYFRQAVENRYLSGEKEKQSYHLKLAEYFEKQELGTRKIEEFPWQLTQARVWKNLFTLLTGPDFFQQAWNTNEYDVKRYWAELEANSQFKIIEGYRDVLNSPQKHQATYVWTLGILIDYTGHGDEASVLRRYLVDYYRKAGDKERLQGALGYLGSTLFNRSDLEGAMKLFIEQERICRKLENKDGLQLSLCKQASVLTIRRDLDGAMKLLKEEERICLELGNKKGLQVSLGNQAVNLYYRGDLDGAMKLHKEEERICRELGDKVGLSASLGNQASILEARGDLDGAMRLQKEFERTCRELGDKIYLHVSLGNQAHILEARGDLDAAMKLYKEEERICRESGYKAGLSTSLGCQAQILEARRDRDGATKLYKEQEAILRELGVPSLVVFLFNQSKRFYNMGNKREASKIAKEALHTAKKLGLTDLVEKMKVIYKQWNFS